MSLATEDAAWRADYIDAEYGSLYRSLNAMTPKRRRKRVPGISAWEAAALLHADRVRLGRSCLSAQAPGPVAAVAARGE